MGERKSARLVMQEAYSENEAAYLRWAEQRKLFRHRCLTKYYFKKGLNREKRKESAEAVLRDFPGASWREVSSQIGGSRDIIWEFGLWETQHDPYWLESSDLFTVYDRLRLWPDEIQEAISDPYQWSKKIHIKTSEVRKAIPRILEDIGSGLW